jgi:O-antigen/teichoic acid export membrane protein
MGKIKSQGISNTIWTYIGILAGGLYSIFIIPKAFATHPEYWGFIQFLVYYMQVFLPLAQIGMSNTIIRFYTKVKTEDIANFYSFVLLITFFMTVVVSVLYFQYGNYLTNTENSELFRGNYIWLIPMLIGSAFFETFSAISRARLKSKVPVFLKESFPKLWTLGIITAYWLVPLSFELFLLLYSSIYIIQLLVLLFYLVIEEKLSIKFNSQFFRSILAKKMYPYMLLSMFITSAALWSVKIDILMIGYLIDLQHVAYYSIALYMATLIIIPFRSMSSIATPMIAGYWTNNQLQEISTVLRKVSEVSLAAGSFIFLALWLNIDWIVHILGDKFGNIKWVFFIIGISRIVDSSFSINGGVLLTSKFYKVDLLFQAILVLASILLNFWLIPLFSLEGAALATLVALLLYNIMKWIFLLRKFQFLTFSNSTVTAVLLLSGFLALSFYNPLKFQYWLNAFVSIAVLSAVYLFIIYRGNLSKDIKESLDRMLSKN